MYKETDHNSLSWTTCFDDTCSTHQSAKDGAGWYPQAPMGRKTLAITHHIQPEEPEFANDFISKVTPDCIKIYRLTSDQEME